MRRHQAGPQRRRCLVRQSETGVGADDRSGAAVISPPLWPSSPQAAPSAADVSLDRAGRSRPLRRPASPTCRCSAGPSWPSTWTAAPAEKVTIGATGGYRMEIDVRDWPAMPACARTGVSAIAIAGLAIAELHSMAGMAKCQKRRPPRHQQRRRDPRRRGHQRRDRPSVAFAAEARSHDPRFRSSDRRAPYRNALRPRPPAVYNTAGRAGKVEIDGRLDYESFRLADDEPSVLAAEAAVRRLGRWSRCAPSATADSTPIGCPPGASPP